MAQSRCGAGDWELPSIGNLMSNFEQEAHIDLSMEDFLEDLKSNVFRNATPGGGIKYDIVIKQVNLTSTGSQFLNKLFGCPPAHTIFCFREPNSWLPSAMKKFNIEENEAVRLYMDNLQAYSEIGGVPIEYSSIGSNQAIKFFQINTEDFIPTSMNANEVPELTEAYNRFKASQSLD